MYFRCWTRSLGLICIFMCEYTYHSGKQSSLRANGSVSVVTYTCFLHATEEAIPVNPDNTIVVRNMKPSSWSGRPFNFGLFKGGKLLVVQRNVGIGKPFCHIEPRTVPPMSKYAPYSHTQTLSPGYLNCSVFQTLKISIIPVCLLL